MFRWRKASLLFHTLEWQYVIIFRFPFLFPWALSQSPRDSGAGGCCVNHDMNVPRGRIRFTGGHLTAGLKYRSILTVIHRILPQDIKENILNGRFCACVSGLCLKIVYCGVSDVIRFTNLRPF